MAVILNFKPEARPARPPALHDAKEATASIVIFPGVRYERYAEPEAASAGFGLDAAPSTQGSDRKRRPRDLLDLLE